MLFEKGRIYIHTYDDVEQLVVCTDIRPQDERPEVMGIIDLPFTLSSKPSISKSFHVKDPRNYQLFTSPTQFAFVLKQGKILTIIETGPVHTVYAARTGNKITVLSEERYFEIKYPGLVHHMTPSAEAIKNISSAELIKAYTESKWIPDSKETKASRAQVLRQEILDMGKDF
jgi:hypothetical protein